MTWQVLHYVAGFRQLGFDTWYVEDSSIRPFDPDDWNPTEQYSVTANFIDKQMELAGLGDRWVFRPSCADRECYGALDLDGLERLYREADAVFNLCGSHKMRPEHESIRCPVLVETDPVPYQIWVAQGAEGLRRELDKYRFLCTYGENLGTLDSPIPLKHYDWVKTRPPVIMEWWSDGNVGNCDERLTTVANFNTKGVKDVQWNGEPLIWSKADEMRRFVALPRSSPVPLEMSAVGLGGTQIQEFEEFGWIMKSGRDLSLPLDYRKYIQSSWGEFSIAKQQYVKSRSGWFSDRSVCYLASGRPVILQDTGFSSHVPIGSGLLAFDTPADALEAITKVSRDYQHHSSAAREVATGYFSATTVLKPLVSHIGLL